MLLQAPWDPVPPPAPAPSAQPLLPHCLCTVFHVFLSLGLFYVDLVNRQPTKAEDHVPTQWGPRPGRLAGFLVELRRGHFGMVTHSSKSGNFQKGRRWVGQGKGQEQGRDQGRQGWGALSGHQTECASSFWFPCCVEGSAHLSSRRATLGSGSSLCPLALGLEGRGHWAWPGALTERPFPSLGLVAPKEEISTGRVDPHLRPGRGGAGRAREVGRSVWARERAQLPQGPSCTCPGSPPRPPSPRSPVHGGHACVSCTVTGLRRRRHRLRRKRSHNPAGESAGGKATVSLSCGAWLQGAGEPGLGSSQAGEPPAVPEQTPLVE